MKEIKAHYRRLMLLVKFAFALHLHYFVNSFETFCPNSFFSWRGYSKKRMLIFTVTTLFYNIIPNNNTKFGHIQ